MTATTSASHDFVGLANPLQGTDSTWEFSNGNTNPLVALPWGMTHWSLQTREEKGHGSWQFKFGDRKLQGIRATHQPSPWITDYGHFTIMPVVGQVAPNAVARSSSFRYSDLTVQPDYLRVYLRRYLIELELTPTERCAHWRVRFPKNADARLLLQAVFGPGEFAWDEQRQELTGAVRGWGEDGLNRACMDDGFRCYMVVRASRPIARTQGIHEGQRSQADHMAGDEVGIELCFASGQETVELTVGTSFISVEQARRNLELEIGNRDFEATRQAATSRWNEILGRIRIDETEDCRKRTFYSALYRSLLFPRMFHEPGPDGKPIHYSPYTAKVELGVLSADNGFWDTFRTVYPLLALAYPKELGQIIEGWTNAAREGGHYPKWASPGYRACMIGTHIDAVVADAIVKDIPGFDRAVAYEYVLKNGREPGPNHQFWGRLGLEYQRRLGYVPSDGPVRHGSARTLEFAYNDFCIAQIARAMGDEQTASEFDRYAQCYRHVFDAEVGLMRGRLEDGSWRPDFNPLEWSGPFCEAAAIQYSYMVPHDVPGLIELMGGREAFVAGIEQMLASEPSFDIGEYPREMHEMSEMAAVDFGQYAHCNQPSHHILYLFALAGRPDLTNQWVRRAMDELYAPLPDGLPGDEDNGEMSAWYVLSALGLYSVCPGTPDYVLSCPRFKEALIDVPNQPKVTIRATGPVSESAKVERILVDGEAWHEPTIAFGQLRQGVVIEHAVGNAHD